MALSRVVSRQSALIERRYVLYRGFCDDDIDVCFKYFTFIAIEDALGAGHRDCDLRKGILGGKRIVSL
jgi:hypothetical protein